MKTYLKTVDPISNRVYLWEVTPNGLTIIDDHSGLGRVHRSWDDVRICWCESRVLIRYNWDILTEDEVFLEML